MFASDKYTICPNCGAEAPADARQCPNCGEPLLQKGGKAWFRNLNPAEIFLLILGSIMLLVGLVAI